MSVARLEKQLAAAKARHHEKFVRPLEEHERAWLVHERERREHKLLSEARTKKHLELARLLRKAGEWRRTKALWSSSKDEFDRRIPGLEA